VLVIAEAGVNHDGELDKALALVDAAASAGADVVKFQTFRADSLVTKAAPKAAYQQLGAPADESQYAMLRRLELGDEDFTRIRQHCQERGIEFLSTGFDAEDVDLIVSLGVRRLKVPSGELPSLPLLRSIARHRLPVLLSTGMATMDEVRAAVAALTAAGLPPTQLTVLHCTSAYPTAPSQVNLRAMVTMGDVLGLAVGYSDHTDGWEVPVAAVALGAVVIEKHLTLSRTDPGPDHAASLEPDQFTQMVGAVRRISAALGDGIKRPQPDELDTRHVARRSIAAKVGIAAGEPISAEHLTVLRPASGLSPMRWDDVLGCKARRDLAAGEILTDDDVIWP